MIELLFLYMRKPEQRKQWLTAVFFVQKIAGPRRGNGPRGGQEDRPFLSNLRK